MTPAFDGPRTITRDGETCTEWHLIEPNGYPTVTLRARGGVGFLVDHTSGAEVMVLTSEFGSLAAMLTDAQQHLTGGQR
ncbi:hypothetical protein BJF89_01110 [Corynebacterium sp. CNJ-954]|uniref:hypothetical protein n=1 Tax=Corynebacterium sp. CNJ-954 TaxID=1904962 RepID=UPI0009661D66|nr:hypothetical protein [Corynebacterium sp. CNJ-954]OLT54861.1 hypothetical protein BJF89_01110 [Corynebacterium sp. CNJ-954]